ncbi:NADH pyrophosphatase [Halomonadaceae bacterium LMG 33818]|uniref:NAD(+) diphosphatase n=1 Tax=Cernens ardua TaxID=3402176 RepID=UPI003EDC7145
MNTKEPADPGPATSTSGGIPCGIAQWPVLERDLMGHQHLRKARRIRIDNAGHISPGVLDAIISEMLPVPEHAITLGHWRGEPLVLEVLDHQEPEWPEGRAWMQQPDYIFPLISTALQLSTWQRDHRFCGRCGSETRPHSHEMAMQCVKCKFRAYPRISPCVITLVTYGRELLLARSPRFKAGRFSTLAGFIEAGESAEEALRREVREEVGVEIGRVHYFKSQSWPFPHSFMLAFYAEALTRDITIDGIEIEAADWFQPESLPALPGSESIAWELIDNFVRSVAVK